LYRTITATSSKPTLRIDTDSLDVSKIERCLLGINQLRLMPKPTKPQIDMSLTSFSKKVLIISNEEVTQYSKPEIVHTESSNAPYNQEPVMFNVNSVKYFVD
jgi:hypothetical protein